MIRIYIVHHGNQLFLFSQWYDLNNATRNRSKIIFTMQLIWLGQWSALFMASQKKKRNRSIKTQLTRQKLVMEEICSGKRTKKKQGKNSNSDLQRKWPEDEMVFQWKICVFHALHYKRSFIPIGKMRVKNGYLHKSYMAYHVYLAVGYIHIIRFNEINSWWLINWHKFNWIAPLNRPINTSIAMCAIYDLCWCFVHMLYGYTQVGRGATMRKI